LEKIGILKDMSKTAENGCGIGHYLLRAYKVDHYLVIRVYIQKVAIQRGKTAKVSMVVKHPALDAKVPRTSRQKAY
jgi:hypothetical protein